MSADNPPTGKAAIPDSIPDTRSNGERIRRLNIRNFLKIKVKQSQMKIHREEVHDQHGMEKRHAFHRVFIEPFNSIYANYSIKANVAKIQLSGSGLIWFMTWVRRQKCLDCAKTLYTKSGGGGKFLIIPDGARSG